MARNFLTKYRTCGGFLHSSDSLFTECTTSRQRNEELLPFVSCLCVPFYNIEGSKLDILSQITFLRFVFHFRPAVHLFIDLNSGTDTGGELSVSISRYLVISIAMEAAFIIPQPYSAFALKEFGAPTRSFRNTQPQNMINIFVRNNQAFVITRVVISGLHCVCLFPHLSFLDLLVPVASHPKTGRSD